MAYENKTDIVIDIETVVHPVTQADVDAYMQEYEPPANYKDPLKIIQHRENAAKNAIENIIKDKRFSLEGKRMISCALGVANSLHNEVQQITSFAGDELSTITRGVVDYLNQFGAYRLIGFNHLKFDLPELLKSFALTKTFPMRRPAKWDLIDLCRHPFEKIGLKTVAKAFGLPDIKITGEDVAQLYADQDWSTIKKYNEYDVAITGELYLIASRLYSFA